MKIYKLSLLIFFFLFIFFPFSFPQNALKKGNYTLGGSILYSNSKNTFTTTTPEVIINDIVVSPSQSYDYTLKNVVFQFSPSYGYFITDGLLAGGNISFLYSEMKTESSYQSRFPDLSTINSKSITREFGLGPSIRYYLTDSGIIPFTEATYNFSKETVSKRSSNNFTFSAGLNYFLSGSIALEPYISYSITSYNDRNSDRDIFSVGIRVGYFIVRN